MPPWRIGVLALIAAIGVVGCGGGGGAGPAPPPTGPGAISGIATNTRGGSAVDGATVTAAGTSATAVTNSGGAYTLTLSPGTYDILAAKSGMAASKFQNVIVQPGQTSTANLIIRTVFDPIKPVAAPTISVSGLSQGQIVAGTISFTVNVTASNPVRNIDARASNMSALPEVSVTDSSTAVFTLNSTALANGPGFVDIIAYDLNYNIAELLIGFTVSNPVAGGPPATPTGLSLIAVTTGQSLGLFAAQRATIFSKLGLKQDPNLLNVRGRSVNLLSAPPDATLFVEVTWNAVPGAVGYKIYRSFNAAGPFVQLAQRNSNLYDDADPSLAPGVTVYYRVSAFNSAGESPQTGSVAVTPLPAFNLNLAGPPNDSTGITTVPSFIWSPTAVVGTDRLYDIVVWGLNDSGPAWFTTGLSIVNSTTISYGTGGTVSIFPLQSGKLYQWDIYEALAITVYGPNSVAVAIANADLGGPAFFGGSSGSLNGPFKFTTVQ